MTIDSLDAFKDALQESRLFTPTHWEELAREWLPRYRDPQAAARQLRALGWLTPYQVDCLFQGRGQELIVGQCVLLEPLGEGGMARVFKARHRQRHGLVAIKILRPELHASNDAVRRFKREIRAVCQLAHPNIVHAYEADEFKQTLYYVMEYCEGVDLGHLVLRSGPLPVEEACEYVRQAATGLQHAHEHGQVHRDIKPANLLLTGGGSVIKILDLGLVSLRALAGGLAQSILTQEWTMLGTPNYVAPEQIVDARTVDHRADLYSLGCTFYFLLTGAAPFAEASDREKLLLHRCAEPQPVEEAQPRCPPEVGAVVRRLMAKNPANRYASAAEVAVALDDILSSRR